MSKSRWIFTLSIAILILPLLLATGKATAQDGTGTERFKTVTQTFTQYTWRLVSRTGVPICTVLINHEGFPTASETLAACEMDINAVSPSPTPLPEGTPQPISTPINMNQFFLETYWVFDSSREVTTTTRIPVPDIIINIYPPGLPVNAPYVIIKAIEPFSEFKILRIAGFVNNSPFECLSDQCIVPLTQDSQLQFWAESSFGDQSEVISVTARTFISNNAYNVRLTNLNRKIEFVDSCKLIWKDTGFGDSPDWTTFPESPDLLNTQHTLHYLSGKLILNKFVNASSCPEGGLFGNGAPNACGLELAKESMLAWQNRFDANIWAAGKEYGIPPVLIKSIMEQETQFWPENARYLYEEYGFSQVNELGADVALRWDEDLKNQICSTLLFDCDPSFANMNSFEQAMLRGGLIRSIDAYCPECENMVNLDIAEQSIAINAQVMRANCSQTNYIVEKQGFRTTLTDMWKFTLLSYHGGYYCLEDSLKNVKAKGLAPTWDNVADNLTCPDAKSYVDSVWDKLTTFQFYYAPQPTLSPFQLTPTGQANLVELEPTETPIPSPTQISYLTDGEIHIFLYIDLNNNLVMDSDELISNAHLLVTYANGIRDEVPVINGEGIIYYKDQFKNSDVKIVVKELYHQINVKIPESGQLFNIIRIPPPNLPRILP